jgi:hypothetical protein
MITCILILVILTPFALLPLALESFFSPEELSVMGICLEHRQPRRNNGHEPVHLHRPTNKPSGLSRPGLRRRCSASFR